LSSSVGALRARWKSALDAAASVAMLLAATLCVGSFLAQRTNAKPAFALPKGLVSLDGAFVRGLRSAPVAIVVFSDFQCPYCRRFAREVLPALDRAYLQTGQAFLAYRHLPLGNHALAARAAAAADCAGEQGRFWELHDWLFEDPRHLQPDELPKSAVAVGVDSLRFQNCMAAASSARPLHPAAEARRLGIRTVPAFLLGTPVGNDLMKPERGVAGAQSFEYFSRIVDEIRSRVVRGTSARRD